MTSNRLKEALNDYKITCQSCIDIRDPQLISSKTHSPESLVHLPINSQNLSDDSTEQMELSSNNSKGENQVKEKSRWLIYSLLISLLVIFIILAIVLTFI